MARKWMYKVIVRYQFPGCDYPNTSNVTKFANTIEEAGSKEEIIKSDLLRRGLMILSSQVVATKKAA